MDEKVIASIKGLGIDMIAEANSGHPGIVLGAAPIIYTVYAKHMNINLIDKDWINRDRFILSAGHGSALLYATLFCSGLNISLDDLKSFRQSGSKTPGHPEFGITPGVDMSTGPLGQGFASAVGMAMAEKILESRYILPSGKPLIKYNVYTLCGDGDLMEGVSYEAASLAGSLNLDNLIVLYDSNNISLDGDISNTFVENIPERFKSMGWNAATIKCSVGEIDKAINDAKKSGKPSLIEVKTIIGEGSLLEGTNAVHGKCLTKEDISQVKQKLGLKDEPFFYHEESVEYFKKVVKERASAKYELWARNYKEYVEKVLNNDKSSINFLLDNKIKVDLNSLKWHFDKDVSEATRLSNSKIMNAFAPLFPNFIGGSADLASSTLTTLKEYPTICDGHYEGRNIWFGVREHAMGSILNGLALSGFRPFGSTFFTFSDYLKPAIRLSALMKLPVTYIFTHDSIKVGEDGPTHQPVEQLAMLRSIPNLDVYRPADAKEIVGTWNEILNGGRPSAIILSRESVPLLMTTSAKEICLGAYVVRMEREFLNGIIIATGADVSTAIKVADELYATKKIDIRVVSMPSMELFLRSKEDYQKKLLPLGIKTIVIESASSFGWHRFVYNENYLITINDFGISAKEKDVLNHFNFDYEHIKERVEKLLK